MKQILSIILITFILISCSIKTDQKQSAKTILNSKKEYKEKEVFMQQDSLLTIFKPDIEIEEIGLLNSENINKYLGEDVMDRLTDNGILYSDVLSSDFKQKLTFYFHPGGIPKEFSEFQVNYIDNDKLSENERITGSKEFVTESGIKLGISIETLKSIKGEPTSIVNEETNTLKYRIDDFNNSEFLQKYNMPIYYAYYEFQKGYLIKFRFGFEYP